MRKTLVNILRLVVIVLTLSAAMSAAAWLSEGYFQCGRVCCQIAEL